MKHLPRQTKLVIACANAMALMFAQQAFAAETSPATTSNEKTTVQQDKKSLSKEQDIETITVTGYRSSLQKALDKKREAHGVVDAIIAEDIGKMADANVAEALQRITGVSINREGGEGTTVSIRGLGPEMNQVSINGQVISGGGDGGAVSFDVMSADMLSSIEIIKSPSASTEEGSLGGKINLKTVRPLDRKYRVFTGQIKQSYNELADQVDPSFQLNYIDQLLDNTLGVAFTATYERRRSRTDRIATYGWEGNQFSNDTSGRTYMESDDGTVYRLDKTTGNLFNQAGKPAKLFDHLGNEVSDVDASTLTEQAQTGYLPTFLFSEYATQDRTRKGLNFTLEYKPSDALDTYFDFSHTQLDTINDKSMLRHSFKRGAKALDVFKTPGVYTGAEIDPESETITKLTDMRGSRQLILQNNQSITETSVANLGFDYEVDVWNIAGRVGYSLTKQSWPADNRFVFSGSEALHGYSLGDNPQTPEYLWSNKKNDGSSYPQHPPVHPDSNTDFGSQLIDGTWYSSSSSPHNTLASVYENDREVTDSTVSAQLDVEYLLDSEHFSSIEFGFKYTDRATERDQVVNGLAFHKDLDLLKNSIFLDDRGITVDFPVDNFLNAQSSESGAPQGVITDWAFGDFNQINQQVLERYNDAYNTSLTHLSQMPWRADLRQSYTVNQEFIAIYAQANIDTLDGRLVGDFGLRVVQTNTDSTGYAGGEVVDDACLYTNQDYNFSACEALFIGVTAENNYTEVLPSANFRYTISENLLSRVAIGRAMARPTMFQIAPYVNESVVVNNPENASRRAGNPYLAPMTAWQYDLTLEWYFQPGGVLTGGLFYKDIDTFIYDRTDTINEIMVNANGDAYTGIYVEADGEVPIQPYKRIGPVNGEGATIAGLEASYQQSFDKLPDDWSGLGVALNYTYADSQATYVGSNDIGEEIAVETAFKGQSKHTYNASLYWEKYGHSVRLSYNYRTDSLYQPISSTKDMLWSDAYGQLDFAARFKLNKYLNIGIQAVNLTDEVPYRYHTNAWDGNPVDESVYENRLSSYTVNGRTFRLTLNATF